MGEVHSESLGEVRRLADIAASAGKVVDVALRVNPSTAAAGRAAMRMGGRPSQFGIDEDQLAEVVGQVDRAPALRFVGLHLNTGTQLLDVDAIMAQYQHAAQLAELYGQRRGTPLDVVNLGGGLGIPYFVGQQPLDTERLAGELRRWLADHRQNRWLESIQWVVEPGRFLVGESGIYVTTVVDIKSSRGETFIVLDGGMHHHLAASGNFGQTIKRPFPSAILNRLDETATQVATLVGPLCTPLDTLGRNVLLPACREGDLVGIFQSGAYAISASPLNFLGHDPPRELWIERDDVRALTSR